MNSKRQAQTTHEVSLSLRHTASLTIITGPCPGLNLLANYGYLPRKHHLEP